MRTTICLSVIVLLLAGCAGGGSKVLSPQEYRTVDVHARDGQSMVQSLETSNDQKWLAHVGDYRTRCLLPGMPERTRLLTYSGLASQLKRGLRPLGACPA